MRADDRLFCRRATAIKLASLGASIALCDINASALETVAAEISTPTHTQAVDVGSTEQVQSFVDGTVEKLGRIDHVFNCAGVNPTSIPLEDTPDEYWE
jgi:NAD(P)-dependent dehydrogenase (short-subunit alcohol dehydrogenase family)